MRHPDVSAATRGGGRPAAAVAEPPSRPSGFGSLAAALRLPGTAPLIVAVLVAAFYAPLLGRWFTSEDFLLLRFLRDEPPWGDWAAWWLGPWLGIEVVRFYRPVATLLLALEAHAFAGTAWAYNLVHLLVHTANALMLWVLARDLGGPQPGESRLGGPTLGGSALDGSAPGRRRLGAAVLGAGGERRGEVAALAAAVLFAIHPLHPNAVSWVASFATPFATAFLLAAFLAHRRFRHLGSRRWQLASLVLFALALGSYEAAVVLPVLVALSEHLLPPRETTGAATAWRRHRAAALAWLPLAVLAAGYLLLRRAIFGQVVGGYQDFAQRLDAAEAVRLAGDLVEALAHLLVPVYAAPVPGWAPLALAAVLLLPLLVLAPSRREVAAWVFGWSWAVVALAPFAFAPFVPGNGRYAYLSALGAAFALGRLAEPPGGRGGERKAGRAAERADGRGRTEQQVGEEGGEWSRGPVPAAARNASAVAVLILAVGWSALLVRNGRIYREAGETARRVSAALAATPEAARGGTVFVAGYPVFLENALGVPIAQVFHYGLADSVRPPFRDTALAVYPLPPRGGTDWWPIATAFPDAGLYTWDPVAERLQAAGPSAAQAGAGATTEPRGTESPAIEAPAIESPPTESAASGPAVLEARLRAAREITYRPLAGASGARYRLLLTARGNPTVLELPPSTGEEVDVPLPAEFLATMEHLYAAQTYWWVEARDASGRLLAASPLRPVD